MILYELHPSLTDRQYEIVKSWHWENGEGEEVSEEVAKANPKAHKNVMSFRTIFFPNEIVQDWLKKHCSGEVSWDDQGVITFHKDRDAVLFKMTFG